jgi:transcription elongation factor Elf1
MKTKEEVVKEMQLVVEQMRLDDIEENPDSEYEMFTCHSCGEEKPLAGSVQYGQYRLCNDCVLYAEVGFELGQIKTIDDLIDAMEDRRLEADCEFIKNEEKRLQN